MNALEKIIDVVEATLPGWTVETGYGADVHGFLMENRIAGKLVFISVGMEAPNRYTEDGRASGFRSSFGVWLRARTARGDAVTIYEEYLRLRDALNGVPYTAGLIQITDAAPMIGGGMAEPQINLETV